MKGFIRIFNQRAFGEKLSEIRPSSQKVFWYLIDKTDWRLGSCVCEHADIADELNMGIRTVERSIKELTDSDLIKRRQIMYAVNPQYVWGGRSWNISKAEYYRIGGSTSKNIINFAEAVVLSDEKLEEAGRETLREISARKLRGT